MTTANALLVLAAVLALLFLIHRFAPAKAAQAEHWAATEVTRVEKALPSIIPTIEAEALHALAAAETWLTDTSAEDTAIAKANAQKATKQAALRTHVATLQAKLPPVDPTPPPAA